MTLWMVRAGKHGELEELALREGLVSIGFNMPDLSNIATKKDLRTLYVQLFPDAHAGNVRNVVGQLWRFYNEIQIGDSVVLPLKNKESLYIGRIESAYEFRKTLSDARHIRRVKWIGTVARSRLDQDLRYTLGSFVTVCKITRNDAENRILSLLEKD